MQLVELHQSVSGLTLARTALQESFERGKKKTKNPNNNKKKHPQKAQTNLKTARGPHGPRPPRRAQHRPRPTRGARPPTGPG